VSDILGSLYNSISKTLVSSSGGKGSKESSYCPVPEACSFKPAHQIRSFPFFHLKRKTDFVLKCCGITNSKMMANIERKKKGWEKVAMLNRFCIIHGFIMLMDMHFFKLILGVVLNPNEAI